MITFSIKDLENFSGIKAHTIRTWEQRFAFLQPQRSDKLRRTYNIDELELILDISFLNHNGFKVSQIARMSHEEISHTILTLAGPEHKQEKAIHELIIRMAMMDIQGFESLLESCVSNWGIDAAITKVIIPFTVKAGLMTRFNGKTAKPNLLMIEQLLKQKMIAGLEKTPTVKGAQTILFFLAKQTGELELLYLQYRLKVEGFHIVYISGTISTKDLITITEMVQPIYIVTSLGNKNSAFNADDFFHFLMEELPGAMFLNLGRSSLSYEEKHRVKQTNSPDQLLNIIKENRKVLV